MKLRSIFAGAMAVVATSAFATVHETTTFTAVDSDGILGSAVNQTRDFIATGLTSGSTPYDLGSLKLEGTISIVNAGDFASEGRIQITSPGGRIGAVQMFTATGYTTLSGTASIFVAPGANPVGTWNFRFFESFNDGGDGSVDKVWDTITINYTDEDLPTPPSPPASEDKGIICDPGLTFTTDVAALGVNWFKIEVPEETAGAKFFDVDTVGSGAADTELGLYRSDTYGTLVADDDDDSEGFRSQLTFGPAAGDRGDGGVTGSLNYNGRDGNLTAGVYYLAVATWNTNFGVLAYDAVSATGGAATVTVNLRTNMVCDIASVSGTVNLQNLDGDEEGCEVTFEIREVGSTTPLEVHTIALGAGGTYEFATSVADGTYDVTAKGTHWLRKLNGSVTFAGGAANVDFDLINGDCDPDNEVNIVDAGTLAAAFGSDSESENWNELADLDKDGEVTLVDNGILAANFGQAGDE